MINFGSRLFTWVILYENDNNSHIFVGVWVGIYIFVLVILITKLFVLNFSFCACLLMRAHLWRQHISQSLVGNRKKKKKLKLNWKSKCRNFPKSLTGVMGNARVKRKGTVPVKEGIPFSFQQQMLKSKHLSLPCCWWKVIWLG